MFNYIGKSIIADYETGYLFQIDYLSDKELRWTSLKERTDGAPMTGTETYMAHEITPNVYFVNWIEEDGLVVSQVVDFDMMTVYAFMTWNEDGQHGNRGYLAHGGTVKFVD